MKVLNLFKRKKKGSNGPEDSYNPSFAFIYIFNLIVGIGALSIPIAFDQAGLALGTALMVILCVLSFGTATLVIEAMAAANALTKHRKRAGSPKPAIQVDSVSISSGSEEQVALLGKPGDIYEITEKFEMADMATLFFNKFGMLIYYIIKGLYLYGDLVIYAIAVPKSIAFAVCNQPSNSPSSKENITNITDTALHCSSNMSVYSGPNSRSYYKQGLGVAHSDCPITALSSREVYYVALAAFFIVISPFTFFNMQKQKILQLITSIMRWIALIMMVVIAVVGIVQGSNKNVSPNIAQISGLPALFGISIYSFMCHHSLPGMVTPMTTKRHLYKMLFCDYILILLVYLLLAYTAVFRFSSVDLDDIYTLNFFSPMVAPIYLGYYLLLFPVFTLSTNFPIISITLRETVKALFHYFNKGRKFHFIIERIVFPLAVVVPPFAIAFATQNEELLIAITGSIPGVGVQYVIPVFLAYFGRRIVVREIGTYANKHRSLFNNIVFLVFIMVWSLVCIVLVIVYQVLSRIHTGHTNNTPVSNCTNFTSYY